MSEEGYSPDVEIDHTGALVAARDIAEHETIIVPLHMLGKAIRCLPKTNIIRTYIPLADWRRLMTDRD